MGRPQRRRFATKNAKDAKGGKKGSGSRERRTDMERGGRGPSRGVEGGRRQADNRVGGVGAGGGAGRWDSRAGGRRRKPGFRQKKPCVANRGRSPFLRRRRHCGHFRQSRYVFLRGFLPRIHGPARGKGFSAVGPSKQRQPAGLGRLRSPFAVAGPFGARGGSRPVAQHGAARFLRDRAYGDCRRCFRGRIPVRVHKLGGVACEMKRGRTILISQKGVHGVENLFPWLGKTAKRRLPGREGTEATSGIGATRAAGTPGGRAEG